MTEGYKIIILDFAELDPNVSTWSLTFLFCWCYIPFLWTKNGIVWPFSLLSQPSFRYKLLWIWNLIQCSFCITHPHYCLKLLFRQKCLCNFFFRTNQGTQAGFSTWFYTLYEWLRITGQLVSDRFSYCSALDAVTKCATGPKHLTGKIPLWDLSSVVLFLHRDFCLWSHKSLVILATCVTTFTVKGNYTSDSR